MNSGMDITGVSLRGLVDKGLSDFKQVKRRQTCTFRSHQENAGKYWFLGHELQWMGRQSYLEFRLGSKVVSRKGRDEY